MTDTIPSPASAPELADDIDLDTHADAPLAAPFDTLPEQVAPEQAAPEQAAPEQAAPEQAAPEQAAPDDVASAPEAPQEQAAQAPVGFVELGLSEQVLRAIAEMGYTSPTPIQQQAIPYVLMGRDVLGCAQTGTGKTASFTLPMLDILSGSRARARMPRSLILEPTRELALQVAENFVKYGQHLRLTHALIIGGESMSDQRDLLTRGVDVVIATPGRLIDMFERGGLLLTDCGLLVIDEADRMLDMGFIPDVERIVAMLPANRQTLFFSATMAPEIRRLADAFLKTPKEITVSKPASVATTITSQFTLVADHDKREALRRLIRSEDVQNALIFCNRKRDVDILFKSLSRHGFSVGALHGDMTQPVRFATLEKFKAGDLRLLCCSDVAARGLDIGGLSHVFNFDVPIHAEDYVHRIGRTGRAGREGRAFMLATPDDRLAVEAIEKLTGGQIVRIQIEGLDPVEWAEGSGKRGRGRKGKAVEKKPEAKPRGIKSADRPAAKGAKPASSKPAVSKPAVSRSPELDLSLAPQPTDRPASGVTQARPPAPRHVEMRQAPRRPDNRGDGRDTRDRRARDDDASGPVLGFGTEIPAFMLIRAFRGPAPKDAAAETMDLAP